MRWVLCSMALSLAPTHPLLSAAAPGDMGSDPSARMRDIENVEGVFSNGVMFDPQALLAEVKGKFAWQ
jgi:hypothetical protein